MSMKEKVPKVTLRDQIAISVLPTVTLDHISKDLLDKIISNAYVVADGMIEAMKK